MREIYFDNAATTRPSESVIAIMEKTLREDWGNPSALHLKGVAAEKYVREARETIAEILKVSPGEIIFTSGGTEANNLAIIGGALARRRKGMKILTTAMEHPAVAEPFAFLAGQGYETVKIPVDAKGTPDLEFLKKELDESVILVSVMAVNNEIGAVTPIKEIGELVHAAAPQALYHVDAIQAFGKLRISPRDMKIDALSVSGHKLHGPKGTGFLYLKSGVRVLPILYGGGQQGAMRSGTENVPGIAGMGVACREAYENFDEKIDYLYTLKEHLEAGLSEIPGCILHGPRGREGAPHIVHAAFPGVGSEVLLHTLEDAGIYVSAGSACSTHKRAASPTMTAIRAPKAESDSSVRFSFSDENTIGEIEYALGVLREVIPRLSRYRAK